MPEQITEHDLKEQGRRLLAAVYDHPEHLSLVRSHEPVMVTAGASYLWEQMCLCERDGELDAARLTSRVNGDEAPSDDTHAAARRLLREIRSGDVLSPIESARFGRRTDALERWAHNLRDRYVKEGLAMKLGNAVDRIRSTEEPIEAVTSWLISEIQKATEDATGSSLQHISAFVDEAMGDVDLWAIGESPETLPTGFWSFDQKTGGLPMGELTIFAAPSGAGKTSFLLQLLRQVALIEQGKDSARACVFFSIEMSAKQVLHRAAAAWKGTDLRRMQRDGESVEQMLNQHRKALHALGQLSIFVDPDPSPTLDQMRSRILQVQARHEIALIGVDYDEKVGEENRSEELRVASISKGLKNLAKQTGAACVALSQYNSGPAEEKRPGTDSDLRYSRKKHHEAHTILHWFWPKYWVLKGEAHPMEFADHHEIYDVMSEQDFPSRGIMTCSKNRSGPIGSFMLDFEPEHTRFADPRAPEQPEWSGARGDGSPF